VGSGFKSLVGHKITGPDFHARALIGFDLFDSTRFHARVAGGQTLALSYDAEGHLVKVCEDAGPNPNAVCDQGETEIALFTYDGDGKRVMAVNDGETVLFAGGHFEFNDTTNEVTKYYFAGATRVAVLKYIIPQSQELNYLLGDHLGSTGLVTDDAGDLLVETRYKPWGEVRYTTPDETLPIRFTFTGQYSDSYIKLLDYGPRRAIPPFTSQCPSTAPTMPPSTSRT
jgi:hypothetical protein